MRNNFNFRFSAETLLHIRLLHIQFKCVSALSLSHDMVALCDQWEKLLLTNIIYIHLIDDINAIL